MALASAKSLAAKFRAFDLYGFVYALLLTCVLLVNLLVLLAAGTQNAQEVTSEAHTVDTVLGTRLATLVAEVRDNGMWTEAYDNLVVKFDPEWMKRNVNETFYNNFGVDALFLLNSRNAVVHGIDRGKPFEPAMAETYIGSRDVAALVTRARNASAVEPAPLRGYAVVDGTLYLATAVRVTTDQRPFPAPVPDKDIVFLLMTAVNEPYLAKIGADYGLRGLHLAKPGDKVLLAPVSITGANPVGLDWRPRRPGDQFLKIVLPPVFFMGVLVSVCGYVAIRRLRANMRQLEVALEAAAAGSQAKSEFLAAMSHELRTPLNAVIGFSDIMAAEMFGPLGASSYREFVVTIRDSGSHLLALIDDVLDVSKLDNRRVALKDDEVDVACLIDRCVATMKAEAGKAGVTLNMQMPTGLPPILADQRRLQQIMFNLLSNAVKFNRKGGAVDIAARLWQDALEISIADTGIGIAAADIPKALERFGQVDSRLSRNYEGSGLGLSLAKELIELHGGTLRLESEPDVGTRVTLTIPAVRIRRDRQPAAI